LRELKNATLIKGNIEGNAICYCIEAEAIGKLIAYFSTIANKLKEKTCCSFF
jgi:hypothetical protein